MKKILLVAVFHFLSYKANAQKEIGFNKTLSIEHVYGDESYHIEKMEFEIIENIVYGKITNPNTNSLLSSHVELNKGDLNILSSFLKLANSYQNGCHQEFVSSYIQYYTIKTDQKEIKIFRFCDWKKFTYFDIKQKIFGKYLKNFDREKRKLNDKLFSLLKGSWIESSKLDKLDKKSICTVKKIVENSNTNEFIEFRKNNKFLIHRSDKIIYYDYKIEVLNGKQYLDIFADGNKNGEEFIYGHRFLIHSIDKKEIKLIRS